MSVYISGTSPCLLPSLLFKVFFSQSCPTLCNPMDCSLPDSSVHGILQARILKWVFPFPGDLPNPGIEPSLLYCWQILYHLSHQGCSHCSYHSLKLSCAIYLLVLCCLPDSCGNIEKGCMLSIVLNPVLQGPCT